jgi:hypothetical protein
MDGCGVRVCGRGVAVSLESKNYRLTPRAARLFLAEPAHEAGGWGFGGQEAGGITEDCTCGAAAAADGALHGGGPFGGGPVSGEVDAGDWGLLLGAEAVEAGSDGKGGAGFFEDAGFEERGLFDGGEENFSFAEGGG